MPDVRYKCLDLSKISFQFCGGKIIDKIQGMISEAAIEARSTCKFSTTER